MGLRDIKKELRNLEKEKLLELIADLYKKNKSVKEFFDFYIDPNEDDLFEKYKEKVIEAFYPKRGDQYKLKDGKQAIRDFNKLGASGELRAELMMVYVETGVKFTNQYGDIDENFYSSLETTYLQALKLIEKENLLPEFEIRAKEIMKDTENIGWGFHDFISDTFYDFYQ